MDATDNQQILEQVKDWFRTVIVPNHIKNTEKLRDASEFNINPFLAPYLAAYLTGELSTESVSQVLLYPRVLGTSITTSFGQNMQTFITDVLTNSFGSLVPGIDIEFTDAIDGRKKYCQVKLGPNTINKDDIKTIHDHFRGARNLGRTNNIAVRQDDMVIAILYGEEGQESNHYKALATTYSYPLFIGEEFWHRLTGDKEFYSKLRVAIAEVAIEAKGCELIKDVAKTLSGTPEIGKLAGQ